MDFSLEVVQSESKDESKDESGDERVGNGGKLVLGMEVSVGGEEEKISAVRGLRRRKTC